MYKRQSWDSDDRDVTDVLAEVDAWAAAGADDLALWFGAVGGFARRLRAFAAASGQLLPATR